MKMQIKITKYADIQSKGKYNMATVFYSVDGEEKDKQIVSFKNKDVYDLLTTSGPGTVIDVKAEKDGKFWAWTGATVAGQSGEPSTTKTAAKSGSTGTWETPDERAKKQVYIIRQSSISNAIEFSKQEGGNKSLDEVLTVAKAFEMHVFGMTPPNEEPDIV
jgi:hypothetical protein